MKTRINRLKRDYAPLSLRYSIETLSPLSTLRQVYNAAEDSYEPSRLIAPCVLGVSVLGASEDTIDKKAYDLSGKLTNHKWTVNFGEEEEEIKDDENFLVKGAQLYIINDFPSGTRAVIRYSGTLYDERLDKIIDIKPDEVIMTTRDSGEAAKVMILEGNDTNFQYDPAFDNKRTKEYTAAHEGIDIDIESSKRDYNATYVIKIMNGRKEMSQNEYTLAVKRYDGTPYTGPSATIEGNTLTIDARTIKDEVLRIQAIRKSTGNLLCESTVGVTYVDSLGEVETVNDSYITDEDIRKDRAVVNDKGVLVHPCSCYDIVLKSKLSNSEKEVVHGYGTDFSIYMSRVGQIDHNNEMLTWAEYDKRGLSYMATIDGKVLTDAQGEMLLI